MTGPETEKGQTTKLDVQAEAQKRKMDNAEAPFNPGRAPRSNEPNAGGENRERGDRRG